MTAMTAEQLRAEFDKIINTEWLAGLKHGHADTVSRIRLRLHQLAARLSGMAAVPEGYALVPIRATDEMIQSFHRGALNAAPDGDYHGKPTVSANAMYRAGYAALLFAAPEPPHV